MNMPIDVGFLAIVIVVSGFLLAMFVCGMAWIVLSGLILHYFPNCAYSKWLGEEVLQTEPLSHTPSDWISERMNK